MHLGEFFKKLGLGKRHVFFVLLSIFVTFFTISIWIYQLNKTPIKTQAAAATCYWVGDTNPANWNDASHWSNASGGAGSTCDGGVVPGDDDTVIFDAGNTNEATFDTTTTVAAFQMSAGKVSMANDTYALTTGSLEITGGEFAMADQGTYRTKVTATSFSLTTGTFNIGNYATVDVNGSFTQSSGNFTSGGVYARLYVSGDFDMSGNGSAITSQTHFDGNSSNFKASTLSMGAIYFEKTAGQTTTVTADITTSGRFQVGSGSINAGTYRVTMTGGAEYLNLNGETLYDLTIAGASIFVRDTDAIISHNLTVNTTKSLSVYSSRTLTLQDSATTTLTGSGYIETYNSTGKIVFQDSACSNITVGTSNLKGVVRFQALNEDINIPALTIDGRVDIYNAGASNRTATLGTAGGQTITARGGSGQNTSSRFTVTADGDGNMAVDGATWNPTVTINNSNYTTAGSGADIDFLGTGAGTESITAGSGTWTVAGNIDFTGGTFTAGSSSFVLSGDTTATGASQTITSASQSFNNLTVQSTNTNGAVLADALTVGGYLYVAATGGSNATLNASTNNVAVNVTGNVDYTGGGAGSEVILFGTNTWTLSGGLDLQGGTATAPTGSTVVMNGASKIIYGNQQTFYNIRFSNNTSIGNNENSDYKNFNVNGTLTVDSGKTLTFTFRCNVYMNSGTTTTIEGTITESANHQTLHLIDSAGANLSTGGTLSVIASFETATQDVIIPARIYNGGLAVVNASANNYVATMGTAVGQTITSTNNHDLTVAANGNGNITVDAATYNPTVNVYASGDSTKGKIDFTGTGAGSEIINAGNGTWTVDGSIDFTGGTFNPGQSTVYSRVDGAQNPSITSAGNSFYNFTIDNPDTISRIFTFVDNVNITHTFTALAVTFAYTVKFTAGITCSAASININGVAGQLVTLKSVTDTSEWYFNVAQASPLVSYVSARDSNANGGSTIRAANSTDATGNSNWVFLTTTTVSGTVYTAESKATNIGAGKTIGISVQGGLKETVESGAGGTFSFSVGVAAGDAITIFEDDEGVEEMTLVTQAATPLANITGLEAYTSKVVLTHASAGPMTNTLMAYADSTFDDDIKYTISSGNADFDDNFELWIDSSKTYTPGGTVDVKDIDINGTFTMAANAVAVHGNWDATGGSFTSSGTVTMDGSTAQTITSDGDVFNNLTIKTTNASGTILADALFCAGNLYVSADGADNVLLDAATNNVAVHVDGNLDYVGVGAGNEDIHMGTNTWTLSGNFDPDGGDLTASSATIVMDGAGKTWYQSSNKTFNNVTISGTVSTSRDRTQYVDGLLTVSGTFTVSSGTSAFLRGTSSIAGTIDGTGTFVVQSGGLLDSGGTISCLVRYLYTNPSVTARTYGGGLDFLTWGSNSTFTLAAGTLNVTGDFTINAGDNGNPTVTAVANNPTVNITGKIDYTGSGAGTEIIMAGNGTWTVGGNVDFTGGTLTANSSTFVLNGSAAAQTLTSAANSFNNLTISTTHASGTILADALSVVGNLQLSADGASDVLLDAATNNPTVNVTTNIDYIGVGAGSESISMGSNTWTVTGNVDLTGGTVTAGSSTLILNGTSPQTLTSASQSFNNLTLTNTNAVSGVTLAGSATITGTFTNTTGDSIVTFDDGSTYAFNALNLAGTSGHLITLLSATPGNTWSLNITELSPTANYVSVTDSDASGGSAIDAATGGFNGGGNSNWIFAVATVTVSPASATLDQGATQTFTATADDAQGYNVPTATFSWSVIAGGGSITPVGLFTAGTTSGTFADTVQATSNGISDTASVTVNSAPTPTPTPEPTPEPSGETCTLGNITQVAIQDSSFSLEPGEVKTLGITFLDATGIAVDKGSVANFKMTPDYGNSYWNILRGGGRLTDENLDTINTNFVAGGTRGKFNETIIFSACNGTLKAYATPNIIKQKTIYADMEPETFALQPGESFNFSVSLFDDVGQPVDESCSYSWSLSNASGASIESPASKSTRITGQVVGEYDITVDASCPSGSAKDSSTLAVVKIDENTEWKLSNYFSSITSWEGQKTYVGFIPYIKVGAKWYSRAESLDYKMADPTAARVTGLHPNYPNIPIVEALKAGCYPFQIQATLNRFGKSYFASTNMNIGSSDKSSYYSQFQPTLGSSTLTYQHLVKTNGERYLNLNRNSAAGQSYSNYNWIYVGKPMTTSWIVNDTRIGTLRPYYNASYLDMTNSEYGYFPRALTTIVDFNGQRKIENWDIWVEKTTDKIRFSPSLPESIRIKPNSYFRLWQGYEYANWGEQILAGYKVKSLNQTAASVVNGDVTDIIFKSGEHEGTYSDAITLSAAYSSASMTGGTERKITLVVDNNATADLCSANGFAQVLGVQSDISENQESKNSEKSVGDILRDIWNAIVEAIINVLRWLNNHPVASLLVGFLLALPALISILGTTVLGNLATSVSRFFTGLTAAAIPGKKNRRLGYVYDWQSKKPIKGARISAFNTFSKKLSYQTVTNAQGEFILVLPQGEYYLTVEKKGYKPYQTVSIESSESFNGKRSDGYYEAIYLPSEKIEIGSGQEGFAHSIAIPLSRPASKPNALLVVLIKIGGFISRLSLLFLIVGSIMTLGLVIYDYSNWVNIVILLYYVLVWILYLYRHFTFFSGTASVIDKNDNGVDLALIRVFNDRDKLVQTVVSDRKGHFILNLVKGNYTLQARKAGFEIQETALKVNSLADINRIKLELN